MAAQLIARGVVQVRPLLGGLDGWADAGLPLESYDEATLVEVAAGGGSA